MVGHACAEGEGEGEGERHGQGEAETGAAGDCGAPGDDPDPQGCGQRRARRQELGGAARTGREEDARPATPRPTAG
eukprot:49790-Prorocentrum_lima.AAC.1